MEDIILQVSIFVISTDVAGDSNEKVPIKEEYLKSPTPMFWRDGGGP